MSIVLSHAIQLDAQRIIAQHVSPPGGRIRNQLVRIVCGNRAGRDQPSSPPLFFGAAAMTIAAAHFGMIGAADAQSSKINPIKPGMNTSFNLLKQIDAGVLNVGYAEAGPASPDIEGGQPVERQTKLARYFSDCRSRTTR